MLVQSNNGKNIVPLHKKYRNVLRGDVPGSTPEQPKPRIDEAHFVNKDIKL
jgi:hypothetical protein